MKKTNGESAPDIQNNVSDVPPLANGLSSAEAAQRLQQFGPNVVASEHRRGVLGLLRKFWGVVPWMLELAIILDLVLARWIEAATIFSLLVFNASISYLQESRAQRALALLRQRLSISVRVKRDSRWQILASTAIVPGDLVHLRLGDVVPADVRLVDGNVLLDQSQLTGESLPVQQRAGDTAYAGSLVNHGEATGVVTTTAGRTYFGKTAELIRVAKAPPRLERLIMQIARTLAILVIVLAAGVLAMTLVRGTALLDLLPFALMMLVAAVPVALPMMFTMSATLGARALADKGVLVTRLSAIQDAAAMDVLCIDKTGTLTENKLSVAQIMPMTGFTTDDVLRLAALASEEATQDPIDLAILQAARAQNLLTNLPQRLNFVPFSPDNKRSEVVIRQDDRTLIVAKGAPATLAELTQQPWSVIAGDVALLSADGARVLAVASGSEGHREIAGLIALSDPPRAESAALIENLRQRGIRVLLVTGDGDATARAIATQVGIGGDIAPAEMTYENLDPATVARYSVFARVFPQDKFFLVQALQRAGHVVGMTGDGFNDAPALRQADIGIAVAGATDVAKAAASLVLTRPGLREIIDAIDGSRRIHQRILTWVLTMMSRKLAVPTFIALGIVLFGTLVATPTQMVLLVFFNDLLSMSVATDRVAASRTPDVWDTRQLIITSLGLAVLMLALSLGVLWGAKNLLQLETAQLQTLIFVWLVLVGNQAAIYTSRHPRNFLWSRPYPSRPLMITSLLIISAVMLVATLGWLMAPISWPLAGVMLISAAAFLLVADAFKVSLARVLQQRHV